MDVKRSYSFAHAFGYIFFSFRQFFYIFEKTIGHDACLREKEHLFRYRAHLRFVRARAHVRVLIMRISCAVGMRNAKLRNDLKSTQMCSCTIETSSVPPRKSSENVPKRSLSPRNNFGKSSEIVGKWSEIFGKSSKASLLVCLYNKQNITCPLMDMNFTLSCSTR